MLFCSNSAHVSEIQLVYDRQTDQPSDRDAREHLKTTTYLIAVRIRFDDERGGVGGRETFLVSDIEVELNKQQAGLTSLL